MLCDSSLLLTPPQSLVEDVCVTVEQQFACLHTAVEEARKGVVEVLEGEQKQALTQAENIQVHLEQRRSELMKTLTQINKLSRSKTDVSAGPQYFKYSMRVVGEVLPHTGIST